MKSGKSDVFFLLNGILKILNYNWDSNYNAKFVIQKTSDFH